MLVSVVGPDRVGKTTLFGRLVRELPSAVVVPSVPFAAELLPVARAVEERTAALWKALYDPRQFYLSDRCPFVDNFVYAKVFGRPTEWPERLLEEWRLQLRCVYLYAPAEELRARAEPGDPDPQLTMDAYAEVLRGVEHTTQLADGGCLGRTLAWIGSLR